MPKKKDAADSDGATDPQYIESMARAYVDFWKAYGREPKPSDAMSFPDPVWRIADIGFYTVRFRRPSTKKAYDAFRQKFFPKRWKSRWSDSYINEIKTHALRSLSRDAPLAAVIDTMRTIADKLDDKSPSYRVINAVGGVVAQGEVTLYPGCRLFRMEGAEYEALVAAFSALIESTAEPQEAKPQLLERQLKYLSELKGWTCVEVIVEGDDEKAKAEAGSIAEPLLDFAQMVAITKSFTEIKVVRGVVPTPQPPTVLMSVDGSHGSCSYSFLHGFRFDLSQATVDEFRAKGFEALINAIAKPAGKRTEYESLLLDAMHWIADGERQMNYANRATSYITALEMFFTVAGAPVVRDVTEGVSRLLNRTVKTRQKLRDRIRTLYQVRSDVSHKGHREVEERDIQALREIGINFLARMSSLSGVFSSKSDVREWLAADRLSGPNVA